MENINSKKKHFKQSTLENEFGTDVQIEDLEINTPASINQPSPNIIINKRKSIEEKEEETMLKMRYNLTFKGSGTYKREDFEHL